MKSEPKIKAASVIPLSVLISMFVIGTSINMMNFKPAKETINKNELLLSDNILDKTSVSNNNDTISNVDNSDIIVTNTETNDENNIETQVNNQVVYDGLTKDELVAKINKNLNSTLSGMGDIFVDYAHTADSLLNVLQNLRRIPHRKIITVFGCGGDRDRTKRGPMGRAACENSDIVFVTDDNPRYENREQIFTDIENGIKGVFNNYEIIPGRETAIRKAVLSAGPGDIVLIAGKGHENYQLVQGKTLHFSDTEEAENSLAEKGWK